MHTHTPRARIGYRSLKAASREAQWSAEGHVRLLLVQGQRCPNPPWAVCHESSCCHFPVSRTGRQASKADVFKDMIRKSHDTQRLISLGHIRRVGRRGSKSHRLSRLRTGSLSAALTDCFCHQTESDTCVPESDTGKTRDCLLDERRGPRVLKVPEGGIPGKWNLSELDLVGCL